MAILFASRSTEIFTVSGEPVRGIGINPMQIVDGSIQTLDKFCSKAKDLLVFADLSHDVSEDISLILEQMTASFSLFKKFDTVMNEIFIRPAGIKEKDAEEFASSLKIAGWMFFVLSKSNIPEFTETFELIFMMAAVISHFLNSFDDNTLLAIRGHPDMKRGKTGVIEYMITFLKIKDINLLLRVQESVRNYLRNNLQPIVGPFDLHSMTRLTALIKSLDRLYQADIQNRLLDERLFLANRKKNMSPKLQSPVKKYQTGLSMKQTTMERKLDYEVDPEKALKFVSKRVLDYEKAPPITKNSNVSDLVSSFHRETVQDDPKSLHSQEYEHHDAHDGRHGELQLAQRKNFSWRNKGKPGQDLATA